MDPPAVYLSSFTFHKFSSAGAQGTDLQKYVLVEEVRESSENAFWIPRSAKSDKEGGLADRAEAERAPAQFQ